MTAPTSWMTRFLRVPTALAGSLALTALCLVLAHTLDSRALAAPPGPIKTSSPSAHSALDELDRSILGAPVRTLPSQRVAPATSITRRSRSIITLAADEQPATDTAPVDKPAANATPARTPPLNKRPTPAEPHPQGLDQTGEDMPQIKNLADYDFDAAQLDLPPLPEIGPEAPSTGEPLSLDEVLTSVETTFPLLIGALQERGIADGELVAALGAFDLSISGSALQTPAGFYDNYRADLKLEQQTTANGAKVFGGYKFGRGHFPEWFGDRQTYDGGAFQGGVLLPLLRGAPIDKKRADLYKARIGRQTAEPAIQRARIEYVRNASRAYWDWVAASQTVRVGQDLLDIAVERDGFIAQQVEIGAIVPIERIDNRRVLTSRQAKLIDFRRKSQATAIKLSLYYRDETGTPLLTRIDRAPVGFPEFDEPDARLLLAEGLEVAANNRPEIVQIQLQRQRAGIDLEVARNSRLPTLDAVAQASQNVGGPTDKFDKSQAVVEAGVMFDVPLQRRQARGDIQKTTAQLARLAQQLEYARNIVTTEVQEAVVNLSASYQQVDRTRESVVLAERMEQAERARFELGQGTTNILVVNLRELATADARLLLVEETSEFFRAWADYRAAVGQGNTEE
jgi:outer membrane protein TolC